MSDYENSDPVPQRQNVVPPVDKTTLSQQELEFLFSPLFEEYYTPGNSSSQKSSAEKNNNINQATNASSQKNEFINPFCTPVRETAKSSSRNINNTNVHSFQPQSLDYQWTKDTNPQSKLHGGGVIPFQRRKRWVGNSFIECVGPYKRVRDLPWLQARRAAPSRCSQYRLSYSDEGQMLFEFVIQNQYFSFTLEDFAQIIRIPCEGACVFSDRWSLDELVIGALSEGPYQTILPSPDDIISAKSLKIRGTRRGPPSTSSSAFDQPSSSHLNDDDNVRNSEGTSRASTSSPIRYVNSLTNQVPQVFQNPPNIEPHLKPLYCRQTEIINCQVQLRDEQRGGVRSIGKSLRMLWRNMKK
nr:DNA helicase Pif1-like protein [Tanacetum cinerariifolium]